MDTPGQRLKSVMKHYRLTQQAIGQRIGFTKGYISVLISGKEPITTNVIEGLIKSFAELNIHWLLTGKGEMILSDNGEESAAYEAGILTGVMEPEPPAYVRGEGRLEWLERKVRELEDRVRRLEGEDGKE